MQKLRELKKRIFRVKALEKKLSKGKMLRPYEIIKNSLENMHSMSSVKYKQTPNDVEKDTLSSDANKERFNFARLEKIRREKSRLEKFDKKIYQKKQLRLRSLLEVGEEVLILGRFYKSSVDNEHYFHKQETFLIRSRIKLKKNLFTG